jgi:predicted HAD superfamily hydrolase
MIEPVYVPYEQYRVAKTRCGLDSRIYGICRHYSDYCKNNWKIFKFIGIITNMEFLATDPEVWVRFPALPDFLSSS